MQTKKYAENYTHTELMAVTAAREIQDRALVFVGVGVPMIAGFLAIHTHAPKSVLIFEGGYVGGRPPCACTDVGDSVLGFKSSYVTSLWRVFSDLQRGYCDLAIIGCAQVDKYGNVNTTAIFGSGAYHNPRVRLTGSGGANDMVSSARQTLIMARLEKRRFVSKVDYLTSPGYLSGSDARQKIGLKGGGPIAVITDKAIFKFDEKTKEMYLDSVYPDVTLEQVKQEVDWDLKIASEIGTIEPPTVEEVTFIRSYDPVDIILRRRNLFETVDFQSWTRLVISNQRV